MTPAADVRSAALAAYEAGLSVVPPTEDGEKKPESEWWTRARLVTVIGLDAAEKILIGKPGIETWKPWQFVRPDRARIGRWYANGRTGLGIVCGRVSGKVETLEWDTAEVFDAFKHRAQISGLGDLVERIMRGYLEATPGGGFHVLYRCAVCDGNTKLAKRPLPPDEMGHPQFKTLIETRGEGGFIVTAPSNGKVHPTRGQYRLLRGGFATIVTISPEEREDLFELARGFDEIPKKPGKVVYPTESTKWLVRPGDDWAAKTAWTDILEGSGWISVYTHGDTTYWRRPGKGQGVSASTNHGGHDLLYCWSTSTLFESERGYGKFAAYAVLNHAGDFVKAAAALAKEGFGTPASGQVPAFPLECLPPTFRALVEEGAASMVCPPDYLAVPLLVAAGAAIGNALELELKPGWHEGANLFAAIVGDPGQKKSPALTLAMRPIFHVQRQQRLAFEHASEDCRVEVAAWEAKRKTERGPKPEAPVFPHVVTTDATTEAIAAALLSAKGLLLTKDELVGWVKSMDQYRAGGKGADRQHFLSAWSRSLIKVDRKSNPIPIIVERPHLSVIGGIQPDLLPDLADAAKREDGFLDRLLFAYPEKVADHWSEDGLRLETLSRVEAIFTRLHGLGGGAPIAATIHLSDEARATWVGWYAENAGEMEAEDFPRRLVGPWAKMPAQLARMALILYAIGESESPQIDAAILEAAADLVDYFKGHARRVYTQLSEQRRDGKLTLLQALKERGPLKQWAILHEVFKRNVAASVILGWGEELEEAGLIRRAIETGEIGRPATIWSAL